MCMYLSAQLKYHRGNQIILLGTSIAPNVPLEGQFAPVTISSRLFGPHPTV